MRRGLTHLLPPNPLIKHPSVAYAGETLPKPCLDSAETLLKHHLSTHKRKVHLGL
jgi:hypothetical protein